MSRMRFAVSNSIHLQTHLAAVGEDKCYFVRTRLVSSKRMANRDEMQAAADQWISELPSPPPGNGEEQHLWEVSQ